MFFFLKLWIDLFKDDSEAFIFTLKNPHGIIPTKYKKKYDSPYSHYCDPKYGPFFIGGNFQCADLAIIDLCNQEYSCWTQNTGESGFTCQLGFGASLFVNTNDSNKPNMFSVLDYEVYTHIWLFCLLFVALTDNIHTITR